MKRVILSASALLIFILTLCTIGIALAALPSIGSFPGTPVSRWNLNEETGTRADDVGSNDLTENGTGGVDFAAGQFDENAADFESTETDYLSIADGSQTGLDQTDAVFSISGWVKFETLSTGDSQVLWSKTTTSQIGWEFYFIDDTTDKLVYEVRNSGGPTVSVTRDWEGAAADTWFFITAVSNGASSGLFVDGVQLGADISGATSVADVTAPFQIGTYFEGLSLFDGLMQDVTFFSDALSDEQVTELYDSYFAPPAEETAAPITIIYY